ncbi:hypothetical protein ASD24_16595 [Paenibacillus sp. Root52]|nr:hypothetical protein ASD24_16595 [Paenibacillus sp. Root52]
MMEVEDIIISRKEEAEWMKKVWRRIGAFTGYTFLILLATFFLFSLVAVILLVIYDFQGGTLPH